MKHVYIKFPIWKTRSVGVNRSFITEDLAIEILYTDSAGNRLYPHVYRMKKARALQYPTQYINKNVTLHIIPISDLEIENDDERAEREYKKVMGIL